MSQTYGLFNDSFPPIMDGVAQGTRNIAYWLNKKYGKCYVITPHFPKYADEEEFDVLRYPSVALLGRKPYRVGMPGLSLDLDPGQDPLRSRPRQMPLQFGAGGAAAGPPAQYPPWWPPFTPGFTMISKTHSNPIPWPGRAVRVVVDFFSVRRRRMGGERGQRPDPAGLRLCGRHFHRGEWDRFRHRGGFRPGLKRDRLAVRTQKGRTGYCCTWASSSSRKTCRS